MSTAERNTRHTHGVGPHRDAIFLPTTRANAPLPRNEVPSTTPQRPWTTAGPAGRYPKRPKEHPDHSPTAPPVAAPTSFAPKSGFLLICGQLAAPEPP